VKVSSGIASSASHKGTADEISLLTSDLGWRVTRQDTVSAHPSSGSALWASSLESDGTMITSSPILQSTGVATLWLVRSVGSESNDAQDLVQIAPGAWVDTFSIRRNFLAESINENTVRTVHFLGRLWMDHSRKGLQTTDPVCQRGKLSPCCPGVFSISFASRYGNRAGSTDTPNQAFTPRTGETRLALCEAGSAGNRRECSLRGVKTARPVIPPSALMELNCSLSGFHVKFGSGFSPSWQCPIVFNSPLLLAFVSRFVNTGR